MTELDLSDRGIETWPQVAEMADPSVVTRLNLRDKPRTALPRLTRPKYNAHFMEESHDLYRAGMEAV